MTVDKAKFTLGSEVNGLLRERISCNTSVELQLPANRRNGCVAQPLTFTKEVCFNYALVGCCLSRNTTLQLVFRLHSETSNECKNDSPTEMDFHYRTKLPNRVCITSKDTGQFGDSGFQFTTELRSPSFGLLSLLHKARKTGVQTGGASTEKISIQDQMQFLCFWDYGIARIHQPLPGENRQVNLSGIGIGMRYTVNPWIALRVDYGWQMIDPGLGIPFTLRAYIGAVVSY